MRRQRFYNRHNIFRIDHTAPKRQSTAHAISVFRVEVAGYYGGPTRPPRNALNREDLEQVIKDIELELSAAICPTGVPFRGQIGCD